MGKLQDFFAIIGYSKAVKLRPVENVLISAGFSFYEIFMKLQGELFAEEYPEYSINKPIRLIELFAGYGSQSMAMNRINADFESYRLLNLITMPVIYLMLLIILISLLQILQNSC